MLGRIGRRISDLRRCDSGNTMMLVALGMPMLIGSAGLGVDVAQWYMWKRELQYAVDQAAIAGAWARTDQTTKDTYQERAEQEFEANLSKTVGTTQLTPARLANFAAGADNSVMVSATSTQSLPFTSFLTGSATTVYAFAQARFAAGASFTSCLVAVDEEESGAITLSGNSVLTASCGLAALSTSETAIVVDGNPTIDAGWIIAAGGIDPWLKAHTDDLIMEHMAGLYDPFEDLTPPAPAESLVNRTYQCVKGKSSKGNTTPDMATVQPGTYTGIHVSCATTFKPGIYYINGGGLKITGQHTVLGAGVMFVLTNGAYIDIAGGASVNLTAMQASELMAKGVSADEANALAGMLVFEDRDSEGSSRNKINGNASTLLNGTIYLPRSPVDFAGTASVSSQCLMIAALKIKLTGTANMTTFCPPDKNNGTTVVNTQGTVKLVA